MAGIGFELKKLFNKTSTIGYLTASIYTAVVTLGPFLLATIMILSIQQLMVLMSAPHYSRELYLGSIIYPFVFSQIISSGFSMTITRCLADYLFQKQYDKVIPTLFGTIALALLLGAPPALLFLNQSPLSPVLKILTYLLYMELIIVWLLGVYLSALKDYEAIIRAYAYGTTLAILLAFASLYFIADTDLQLHGIVFSVCSGIFTIISFLFKDIFSFFPAGSSDHFTFLRYLDERSGLFATNFFYTLALYLPNLILWQSPEAQIVSGTYRFFPAYDSATFYAFLSLMPTMVAFVVSAELVFYEKYKTYFSAITGKGNYDEINIARQEMLQTMWGEIRNLFEFQLVFSLLFLAVGDFVLPRFGLSPESVDIYNILVLGAFAIGMAQILQIVLLYFDNVRDALKVSVVFLASNLIFNFCALWLPDNVRGFPFFLSALLTVITALTLLNSYTKQLDYFVFCSQPVFRQARKGPLQRCYEMLSRKRT